MKFTTSTDFTKLPRAVSVKLKNENGSADASAALPHDERHFRRRVIELSDGTKVLVDLPETVQLADGDRLVLDDGREIEVQAAPEEVYDIRARHALHLAELAWHIGNRHLAAEIRVDRILIGRDHVIRAMLEGLGAMVTEIVAPFHPLRGAYGGQGHSHGHSHAAGGSHHHG